jgi:hypothetical protein
VGRLDVDGPRFEGTVDTVMDADEGAEITREQTVYLADCNHYVGFIAPNELAAHCARCRSSICFRCQVRCHRCHRIICPDCARETSEGAFVCPKCRLINLAKRGALSLHQFLGKDFS